MTLLERGISVYLRPAVIGMAANFATLGLRWGDDWTPIFHGPAFIVVPRNDASSKERQ